MDEAPGVNEPHHPIIEANDVWKVGPLDTSAEERTSRGETYRPVQTVAAETVLQNWLNFKPLHSGVAYAVVVGVRPELTSHLSLYYFFGVHALTVGLTCSCAGHLGELRCQR